MWGCTAALATGALLLWLLALRHLAPLPAPLAVPWPLLAAGFAAGHFAGIRFESRGSTHTIDLTDVVLLPACVFAGPGPVLLAAVVGTVVRSVWVRRPVLKSSFNVALHAFAVAVALTAYRAVLGHGRVLSPRGWVAAALAVFAAQVIADIGIEVVIMVSSRRVAFDGLDQMAATVALQVGVAGVLGLSAVYLLWMGWAGGVLFAALAGAAGIGYAAFGRLRSRHERLDRLHRFEQTLAAMTDTEAVVSAVLAETVDLLNAGVVQLVRQGEGGDRCYTRRAEVPETVVSDGPHPVADLAPRDGEPLVVSAADAGDEMAGALARWGHREALVLRLRSQRPTGWVFLAADRHGERHIRFGSNDVVLAQALATPAALALRNCELLDQLRAQVSLEHHQALHDALTGLPNRSLYAAEVDRALAGRPPEAVVGVVLVDIDGFKKLNDGLGHEAGDRALEVVAHRLAVAVADAGTVARVGGDEFAVVLPYPPSAAVITEIAQRIDRDLRVEADLGSVSIQLQASIGVAVAPFHGEDRFELLRQADLAMERARAAGGGVRVQNDRRGDRIHRPSLIAALREAIGTAGLQLYYQPTVEFATGQVVGVEALCRWTHPLYGQISPDQFIPVAEASGLIAPLTRWAIDTALAQARRWRSAGFELDVAVNLSPQQINDPEVVVQVTELLARYELPPSSLVLEITESSALVSRPRDSIAVLDALGALGVQFSLDDFGVGSSSLTRLKHLPVAQLKIDKSFTENLTTDPTDHAIVGSTVDLAHQLGLSVTAEGVETAETFDLLASLGCDVAQGYLVSEPLDPSDLTRWLYDLAPSARAGGQGSRAGAGASGATPHTRRPRWTAAR